MKNEKEIEIEVEITGVKPLLMHRFEGDAPETPKAKKKSETQKENKVEDTLYTDDDGKLYQPAEHIRQSMINAGKAFKKGKSNQSKIVASFVEIEPEAIPHVNQTWTTDRRAVVIPSTRGRVMRNRGRLDEWKLEFIIKILDTDEIAPDGIQDILEHAGKYNGIGDYRPEKKGMFGRFNVTKFKVIK